jgi:hypothetical protein
MIEKSNESVLISHHQLFKGPVIVCGNAQHELHIGISEILVGKRL